VLPVGEVRLLPGRRPVRRGNRHALAEGYNRCHLPQESYRLGRITVDHDDTIKDLEMKLRGGDDWLDHVGRLRSKLGAMALGLGPRVDERAVEAFIFWATIGMLLMNVAEPPSNLDRKRL
jgi:hypothetical protein